MVFLHTDPSPEAPFWLLHFESATLARLILHPGGPHTLHIHDSRLPPDEAMKELIGAVESMGKDVGKDLSILVHERPDSPPPAVVTLAPLRGTGFAAYITVKNPFRRLAIAYLSETNPDGPKGPLGPVWENPPEDIPSRRALIARAVEDVARTSSIDLDELSPDSSPTTLWMEREDILVPAN